MSDENNEIPTSTSTEIDPPAAPAPEKEATPPVNEAEGTLLTKLADEDKAQEADYEIKLPDGMELDADLASVLKKTVKDAEAAQSLADAYAAAQERAATKLREGWQEQQRKWEEEIRSDRDFEANAHEAAAAMRQFGSPELREFLNTTGFGAHPQMFQLFVAVGKALSENSVATNTATQTNNNGTNPAFGLFDHPTSR